jgi:hypothetical protein
MSKKQDRTAAHDDPWATPESQRPDVPRKYTAPIAAATIQCQHCGRVVGLTRDPAAAPAITCTTCMRAEVGRLLRPQDEPPF